MGNNNNRYDDEFKEVYYNRQRRHAALGWVTPVTYKASLFVEDLVA